MDDVCLVQVHVQCVELLRRTARTLAHPRVQCERERLKEGMEQAERDGRDSHRRLRESLRRREELEKMRELLLQQRLTFPGASPRPSPSPSPLLRPRVTPGTPSPGGCGGDARLDLGGVAKLDSWGGSKIAFRSSVLSEFGGLAKLGEVGDSKTGHRMSAETRLRGAVLVGGCPGEEGEGVVGDGGEKGEGRQQADGKQMQVGGEKIDPKGMTELGVAREIDYNAGKIEREDVCVEQKVTSDADEREKEVSRFLQESDASEGETGPISPEVTTKTSVAIQEVHGVAGAQAKGGSEGVMSVAEEAHGSKKEKSLKRQIECKNGGQPKGEGGGAIGNVGAADGQEGRAEDEIERK